MEKAVDDLRLSEYFNSNIDNYKWEDRVSASIYTCLDLPLLEKLRVWLWLNRGNIDNASILEKINKESALNLNIETKNEQEEIINLLILLGKKYK